ncbi:multiple organellar RNA editing factor 3, mitochondrial [Silene latifolia]|uniref:multiple organellar RNA editing factor 3, mitochondrial n=1 Tax=Silene latifolia TaxID=37657 RepID=UPI003D78466C
MAHFPVRRTLTTLLTRTFTQTQTRTSSLRSRLPLSFLQTHLLSPNPAQPIQTRLKSTGSGYSPLNDPSPNWTNRPPKETILLDGCDYEHWLIVMEFPNDPKPSDQDMVNSYVQTLAQIVGSEEAAKKKIYSISTTTYTGFGALISEELSYKVKALPGVLWVLPDSYLDVPNKDYGGDLFVDGKVIRRPEYDFSERQTNPRHRPRPRQDRRSRGPTQIQNRTQSMQQSMNRQNVPQS